MAHHGGAEAVRPRARDDSEIEPRLRRPMPEKRASAPHVSRYDPIPPAQPLEVKSNDDHPLSMESAHLPVVIASSAEDYETRMASIVNGFHSDPSIRWCPRENEEDKFQICKVMFSDHQTSLVCPLPRPQVLRSIPTRLLKFLGEESGFVDEDNLLEVERSLADFAHHVLSSSLTVKVKALESSGLISGIKTLWQDEERWLDVKSWRPQHGNFYVKTAKDREIRCRMQHLKAQIGDGNERIDALEIEMIKRGEKLVTQENELSKRNDLIHTYEEQINYLSRELQGARKGHSTLTGKVQRLENDLDARRFELQQKDNELRSMRDQKRDFSNNLQRLKRQLRQKEDELDSAFRQQHNMRVTIEHQSTQFAHQQKEAERTQRENNRMDRELEELVKDRQKFEEMEETFQRKTNEYEQFIREQKRLQVENSELRDRLSDMSGSSRFLDSKFWDRSKLIAEFNQLEDQSHLDAADFLEQRCEYDEEDAAEILWRILFAVQHACQKQFEKIEESILVNDQFRNMLLHQIQENFQEILDLNAVRSYYSQQFSEELGEHLFHDDMMKYVNDCAMICWVMALKNDPQMELFPADPSASAASPTIFANDDFFARFRLHTNTSAKKIKKSPEVRFLYYVLPGVRRTEDKRAELLPCVYAKKANGGAKRQSRQVEISNVRLEEKETEQGELAPGEIVSRDAIEGTTESKEGDVSPRQTETPNGEAVSYKDADGDIDVPDRQPEPGAAAEGDDEEKDPDTVMTDQNETADDAEIRQSREAIRNAWDYLRREEDTIMSDLTKGDVDDIERLWNDLRDECNLKLDTGRHVVKLACANCRRSLGLLKKGDIPDTCNCGGKIFVGEIRDAVFPVNHDEP